MQISATGTPAFQEKTTHLSANMGASSTSASPDSPTMK